MNSDWDLRISACLYWIILYVTSSQLSVQSEDCTLLYLIICEIGFSRIVHRVCLNLASWL